MIRVYPGLYGKDEQEKQLRDGQVETGLPTPQEGSGTVCPRGASAFEYTRMVSLAD